MRAVHGLCLDSHLVHTYVNEVREVVQQLAVVYYMTKRVPRGAIDCPNESFPNTQKKSLHSQLVQPVQKPACSQLNHLSVVHLAVADNSIRIQYFVVVSVFESFRHDL